MVRSRIAAMALFWIVGLWAIAHTTPAPASGTDSGGADVTVPPTCVREYSGIEPQTCFQARRSHVIVRRARKQWDRSVCVPPAHASGRVFHDLPYGPFPAQRLDLYLPRGGFATIVVFVHGGSWISEDKSIYAVVGAYLAAHGVAAVLPDYRLPPHATVQGQLEDVAQALAWTYEHVGGLGGDPSQIFLCGHSSGGHLAAVMATNPSYLAAVGLTPAILRGVIGVGGIYQIGVNVRLFGVGYVFQGMDRRAVSPVDHGRPDLPPFLLVVAQHGPRYLYRQAERFHAKLARCGVASQRFIVPDEDHYGQVLDIACPCDLLGPRILCFVRQATNP